MGTGGGGGKECERPFRGWKVIHYLSLEAMGEPPGIQGEETSL